MKVSSVREFRDNATGLLKSTEPVLITRRGRMAGVFFPAPEGSLQVDMKQQLFDQLSTAIGKKLKKSATTEEAVLEDFKTWKKTRSAARGRR